MTAFVTISICSFFLLFLFSVVVRRINQIFVDTRVFVHDFDLLVAHETENERAGLGQHWDVRSNEEYKEVVDAKPVVIVIIEPEFAPGGVCAHGVEDGAKAERQGEKHVCHPEAPSILHKKALEVDAQPAQHEGTHAEENDGENDERDPNHLAQWLIDFLGVLIFMLHVVV